LDLSLSFSSEFGEGLGHFFELSKNVLEGLGSFGDSLDVISKDLVETVGVSADLLVVKSDVRGIIDNSDASISDLAVGFSRKSPEEDLDVVDVLGVLEKVGGGNFSSLFSVVFETFTDLFGILEKLRSIVKELERC